MGRPAVTPPISTRQLTSVETDRATGIIVRRLAGFHLSNSTARLGSRGAAA
jgi:hypothetical protein